MIVNEVNEENFYAKTYEFVKKHNATNNAFIDRFARGDISEEEFKNFSIEFYHFTREWVAILSTLLVNTPNENDGAKCQLIGRKISSFCQIIQARTSLPDRECPVPL